MRPPPHLRPPVAVRETELAGAPAELTGLDGYAHAFVLVRLHGVPMGALYLPVTEGRIEDAALQSAVRSDEALSERLSRAAIEHWLAGPPPAAPLPSWTVIVCTRDRTEDLQRCLASLLAADHPPGGEIIVVDNAPSTDATARAVAALPVRYEREDRPGLNWARVRGLAAAGGEVALFTDDDVVVDRRWIGALLEPFAGGRVAAAAGLTLPLELETEAQLLFERYGGFSRGFERRRYDVTTMRPASAGRIGAGANMAVRRAPAIELALFEAELDCGTPARTGGDTYAFYRLLIEGYSIVYTPSALNWHRHRRDMTALRRTLEDYSIGGFAYLMRCWVEHGDWDVPRTAGSWLMHDHLRQLARQVTRSDDRLPWPLVRDYLRGVPRAPGAYRAARRREREWAGRTEGGRA